MHSQEAAHLLRYQLAAGLRRQPGERARCREYDFRARHDECFGHKWSHTKPRNVLPQGGYLDVIGEQKLQ